MSTLPPPLIRPGTARASQYRSGVPQLPASPSSASHSQLPNARVVHDALSVPLPGEGGDIIRASGLSQDARTSYAASQLARPLVSVGAADVPPSLAPYARRDLLQSASRRIASATRRGVVDGSTGDLAQRIVSWQMTARHQVAAARTAAGAAVNELLQSGAVQDDSHVAAHSSALAPASLSMSLRGSQEPGLTAPPATLLPAHAPAAASRASSRPHSRPATSATDARPDTARSAALMARYGEGTMTGGAGNSTERFLFRRQVDLVAARNQVEVDRALATWRADKARLDAAVEQRIQARRRPHTASVLSSWDYRGSVAAALTEPPHAEAVTIDTRAPAHPLTADMQWDAKEAEAEAEDAASAAAHALSSGGAAVRAAPSMTATAEASAVRVRVGNFDLSLPTSPVMIRRPARGGAGGETGGARGHASVVPPPVGSPSPARLRTPIVVSRARQAASDLQHVLRAPSRGAGTAFDATSSTAMPPRSPTLLEWWQTQPAASGSASGAVGSGGAATAAEGGDAPPPSARAVTRQRPLSAGLARTMLATHTHNLSSEALGGGGVHVGEMRPGEEAVAVLSSVAAIRGQLEAQSREEMARVNRLLTSARSARLSSAGGEDAGGLHGNSAVEAAHLERVTRALQPVPAVPPTLARAATRAQSASAVPRPKSATAPPSGGGKKPAAAPAKKPGANVPPPVRVFPGQGIGLFTGDDRPFSAQAGGGASLFAFPENPLKLAARLAEIRDEVRGVKPKKATAKGKGGSAKGKKK